MATSPKAIYANIVNIRLTPKEFVMEFGARFPNAPSEKPSPDAPFEPDVRVVLHHGALEGLQNALAQAIAQKNKRSTMAGPKEPQ